MPRSTLPSPDGFFGRLLIPVDFLTPDPTASRWPSKEILTGREQSIVEFIVNGQSNKQIARTLDVTPETVKTHVKRIFMKLSAESRA
ncbi:MAG: helix-turn-helix transcriptional regulator [Rhizobiaceae bacterium]|nr:helix-turn-helix transcriptional regulator [Rhizobiaceae bacterium]